MNFCQAFPDQLSSGQLTFAIPISFRAALAPCWSIRRAAVRTSIRAESISPLALAISATIVPSRQL